MLTRLLSIYFVWLASALNFAQTDQFYTFKTLSSSDFGVKVIYSQSWNEDGSFWAITDKGLMHHDGFNGTFFPPERKEGGVFTENPMSMQKDGENRLLISYLDTNCITVLNTETWEFKHHFIEQFIRDSSLAALPMRIKRDLEGNLWAGSWGDGLLKLSEDFQVLHTEHFLYESDTSDFYPNVKDFVVMPDGNFLVTFFGQNGDMGQKDRNNPLVYNPKTGSYKRIESKNYLRNVENYLGDRIEVPKKIVHFVHQDESGKIWLGTYSGMWMLDLEAERLERISNQVDDLKQLNLVNLTSYVATGNKLWISSPNKGLVTVDCKLKKLEYHNNDPNNANSLADNRVRGISVDPLGHVWVCMRSGDISVYVPAINNFMVHPWNSMELDYTNQSAQVIPVNQLSVYSSDKIYLSNKNGIARYNIHTRESYTFCNSPLPEENRQLRSVGNFKKIGDKIYGIMNGSTALMYDEKDGYEYINKQGGGILFRHDLKAEELVFYGFNGKNNEAVLHHFDKDLNPIAEKIKLPGVHLRETYSFITNNGKWLVSETGKRLCFINPKDYSYQLYSPSNEDFYFPDSSINAVLVEEGHEILVGTDSALYTFNEVTGAYQDISAQVGLTKDDKVNALIRDHNGKLWLALTTELMSWDESTQKSIRYDRSFGINVGEFLPAIAQKDELNNLYFATMNGLLVFNPSQVSLPEAELKLKLINVEVNEQMIDTETQAEVENGNYEFHWSDDFITFQFNTNQIFQLTPHNYQYRLIGQSDQWIDCGPTNKIRFTNLDHGDYQLEVRATNSYDITSTSYIIPFTVKRPYWLAWWFYLILGIVVVSVVFVYVKYREKALKKRQEILEQTVEERTAEVVEQKKEADRLRIEAEHQKDIVEEKNQEILDSINYAKRIQNAIMPPEKIVKQYLKNSFILYKPKDIVAGDFYWMQITEKEVLFAAADCTGHGVPGAMVSVICNNGLNRSVKEFGLHEPGKILDKTRELVVTEFEKSEDEVKDGMDIALCSMLLSTESSNSDAGKQVTLKYAGAHNPLWIIRKDSEEMEEYKANKQPIGQFDHVVPYDTHQVTLYEGDTFYIFSDGFADQFGGEKGKKMKTSNFKNLLLSIQRMSMQEQLNFIDEAFEKWKGNFEQLDDVCVIGVRI